MSGAVRVGVFGAGGRMGTSVCEAVAAAPELDLVAAVDPHHVGRSIAGVTIGADPRAMADAGVTVAVDFTVVEAARTNLQWCALHGVHAVVGTTGFDDADIEDFRRRFTSSNCLIAANFAISAVLMMKFAEMAAPFFDTAEIIELHHDRKTDAPSGPRWQRPDEWPNRHRSGPPIRRPTRCSLAPGVGAALPTFASMPCACAAWSPIKK